MAINQKLIKIIKGEMMGVYKFTQPFLISYAIVLGDSCPICLANVCLVAIIHMQSVMETIRNQCCFSRPLFEVNKLHRKMNGRRQSYPSTIHPPSWIGLLPHQVLHIPPIHDQTPPLFLLPTNGPWTRLLQHFRPRKPEKNSHGSCITYLVV